MALKSLPSHLLAVEVLARLASSDLVNVKLSCKELKGLTDDPYVLEHVSIDANKFPPVSWHNRDSASSFLSRCKECNNPEALYRQGMLDFFSDMKVESGVGNMRRAAARGHVEASYVLGMILLCAGEKGERAVSEVELLRSFVTYKDCREKVKGFLVNMWVSDRAVELFGQRELEVKCCSGCGSVVRKGCAQGWRKGDEDDGVVDHKGCESCKIYRQFVLFCDMLCNRKS